MKDKFISSLIEIIPSFITIAIMVFISSYYLHHPYSWGFVLLVTFIIWLVNVVYDWRD